MTSANCALGRPPRRDEPRTARRRRAARAEPDSGHRSQIGARCCCSTARRRLAVGRRRARRARSRFWRSGALTAHGATTIQRGRHKMTSSSSSSRVLVVLVGRLPKVPRLQQKGRRSGCSAAPTTPAVCHGDQLGHTCDLCLRRLPLGRARAVGRGSTKTSAPFLDGLDRRAASAWPSSSTPPSRSSSSSR